MPLPEGIYVLYQGPSDKLWYSWSSDGVNWNSAKVGDGLGMSQGPGAAVYDGLLYCFYQNDNNLYYVTSDDGKTWAGKKQVNPDGMPDLYQGAAAATFGGKIYCLFQDKSSHLHYVFSDNPSKSWDLKQVPSVNLAKNPGAAVLGNRLYTTFLGEDTDGFLYRDSQADGTWSGQKQILGPISADFGPALMSFMVPAPPPAPAKSTLFCFYQNRTSDQTSGPLYFTTSAEGDTWNPPAKVGDGPLIESGPGAVSFKGKLYCFYSVAGADGDALHFMTSTDGSTWIGGGAIQGAFPENWPAAAAWPATASPTAP